jgi:hypothetical protein
MRIAGRPCQPVAADPRLVIREGMAEARRSARHRCRGLDVALMTKLLNHRLIHDTPRQYPNPPGTTLPVI